MKVIVLRIEVCCEKHLPGFQALKIFLLFWVDFGLNLCQAFRWETLICFQKVES